MCDCPNCRTGKCGCRECREGPGIDFEGSHLLADSIRRDMAMERARVMRQVQITDRRSPGAQQHVRRWGDIERPAITAGPKETGDKDHE